MITTFKALEQETLHYNLVAGQIKTRIAPFHKEYLNQEQGNENFLEELIFHYKNGRITKEEADILLTHEEYGLTFDEVLDFANER